MFGRNMTGNISKRKLRLENRKKKMAALLDIVKLNEYDREQKIRKAAQLELQKKNSEEGDNNKAKAERGPSAKRLKIVSDQEVDEEITEPVPTKPLKSSSPPPPPLIGEMGPSGKPLIHGDDLIVLKAKLRETTKKRRQAVRFRLREFGENARLKVEINERVPMFLSDLQHLIMYSQIGPHSPYSPARWCALEKYNKLVNMNLLIIENVSVYHYLTQESRLPFLSSKFEHKLEMIAPTSYRSDIVKDLSMVPLTGTQIRKYENSFGSLESAVLKSDEIFDTVKNFFPVQDELETNVSNGSFPTTDKFSRLQLLLSGWQMVEENFPLPIQGLMERKYMGYVLTKDKYKHVTPFSPMIAIDCEMCRTSTGELELTRISAVDENHKLFYDTLVKPDNQITDYLTKWSGINKKMMKNVTKKLKDVQDDLRKLLPPDAILVGQSLANDLHALKMMHPYIIDTSVVYNITGDRTRKTKLQVLAREFLKEKIQMGQHGHCPQEDSLACMKLVQLKLKKNLYFGDMVMKDIQYDLHHYADMGTSQYATSMLRQCTKVDRSANVIGASEIAKKYQYYMNKGNNCYVERVKCSSGESNEDVVEKCIHSLMDYSLNVAHVKVAEEDVETNISMVMETIDDWVRDIYLATANPSLLAVLFGGYKKSNGVCFLQLKAESI